MLMRRKHLNLVDELNNIFGNETYSESKNSHFTRESTGWIPAVDIKEDPQQFNIYIDIPGVNPKDIDISMENNKLSIKGKREIERGNENESFHRIERITGEFYRQFTLPATADKEKIYAKSKHGVLEINIAKKERLQPKQIEVTIEG